MMTNQNQLNGNLQEVILGENQLNGNFQEVILQETQLNFLDLFSQQVKETPDKLAVVTKDSCLTYQQLEYRSHSLALRLREIGVKADVLVGICVERSPEMIVGIMAILKAGGAYVPIDPNYPQERISYILKDTQAPVLLTQSWLGERIPEFPGVVIYLDQKQTEYQDTYEHNHQNGLISLLRPNLEDLAYVIYTSGSTGNPKGVMIEHRALYHFILVSRKEYQLEKSDRILQFIAPTFDVSVGEIFPSLATGITLYLRTEEMAESIPALLEQCRKWKITYWNLPTAFWHYLVDELVSRNLQLPPTLRVIMIVGEKVQKHRVATWLDYVGNYPYLINGYGPTEATVIVTTYWISGQEHLVNTEVEIPIGKPLAHVNTYVLDSELQPVASGIIGDLYLETVALARGYLNRPDLTAKSFVSLSLEGQQLRCYKTGDRAMELPDGNLMYLDRADRQVKIRGYRIELGEIESAIQKHPLVKEAVVLAQEKDDFHNNLEKYLVAYLVPKAQEAINLESLKKFLYNILPDYMVPRFYEILPKLPIIPNLVIIVYQ